MTTTFELIKAAKSFMSRRSDGFFQVYQITLDDIFFQLQFVMCDQNHINEEIEKFYIKMSKNAFGLDKAEDITDWINENVLEQSGIWIQNNRKALLQAEKNGDFKTAKAMLPYLPGIEINANEAIRAIQGYLCELPEIHRQTALAYYHCNLPMEKITEVLEVSSFTISERINYIEKTLTDRLSSYCKERGISMPPINTQRISKALSELSKLYKYPYVNELFENIKIKSVQ